MKTSSLINIFAAALTAALFGAGCASPLDADGRLKHKEFQVEESGLDWLDIAYHPAEDDTALTRYPVRISVAGTGAVECKTGRSPQIWKTFSTKSNDPYWNEIFSAREHLAPDEVRDVFQRFIDEGALPDKPPRDIPKFPHVTIVGNISNNKIRLITDNTHLVSLVEEILENFPTLLSR
ncbi:MAG: hypothetical protein FWG05_04470 [Kiritimatiellaeota bacterium]|nr:hypothetical protein [Kiritimatiellota bacterium]